LFFVSASLSELCVVCLEVVGWAVLFLVVAFGCVFCFSVSFSSFCACEIFKEVSLRKSTLFVWSRFSLSSGLGHGWLSDVGWLVLSLVVSFGCVFCFSVSFFRLSAVSGLFCFVSGCFCFFCRCFCCLVVGVCVCVVCMPCMWCDAYGHMLYRRSFCCCLSVFCLCLCLL
jgi:hypothetical protein